MANLSNKMYSYYKSFFFLNNIIINEVFLVFMVFIHRIKIKFGDILNDKGGCFVDGRNTWYW